jgi:formylglycine-generating enzyme required for sulfatase activity
VQRLCEMQVAHSVRITKPFYVAVTETTNQQFAAIFPEHRADSRYSPDGDSPAVRVRWDQAAEFCRILSEREGTTYRLPTEAEWEYACRAGTTTFYSFGVSPRAMPQYGWCLAERTRAAPVALLKPNNWGIYDMHGNVFEWVGDRFSQKYYMACFKQATVDDPQGPQWGRTHVLRSSGWQVDNTFACTCMARFPLPVLDRKPFTGDNVGMRAAIGFRVVREATESEIGGD